MSSLNLDNATIDRRAVMLRAAFTTLLAGGAAMTSREARAAGPITDVDILNFALNLEYLEAEFYQRAVNGVGLAANQVTGVGTVGGVTGGETAVPFQTRFIQQYAQQIAGDELNHVLFLRSALGSYAVARPEINLADSFNTAAQLAGIGNSFDPFANEVAFLVGAFVFEDVGVTAYHGAAPLISNKAYLSAAAGILGVEAYHASEVRLLLLQQGQASVANAIAALRAKASGTGPGTSLPADDQGILVNGRANLVPTDVNSIVFSRTPAQVLNVVYLGQPGGGGFFPSGMNGRLR